MSSSYLFRVSDKIISDNVLETYVAIRQVLNPIVFEKRTEEMWLRIAAEYGVR